MNNTEWSLERRATLYVRKRWETIPDDVRRIVGVRSEDRAILELMWERDFYRELARNAEEAKSEKDRV